jgi:hypothetical protein
VEQPKKIANAYLQICNQTAVTSNLKPMFLILYYNTINGNRTIRPKKYDSAWPNKKQRIVAAFLSFLFGQGRIV